MLHRSASGAGPALAPLSLAAGKVEWDSKFSPMPLGAATSANAPITVFGDTVLVPAGGPKTSASGGGGTPQLVAYTIR